MKRIKSSHILLISMLLLFLMGSRTYSQDIELKLGKGEIALNEHFTITIIIKNNKLKENIQLPLIEGLNYINASNSSNTTIINGQMSSSYTITAMYQAQQEGIYTLPPFSIKINGKNISSKGKTIKVGPAIQQQARRRRDPFEDFFGNRQQQQQTQEYIEVYDDAFLAVTISKNEVYLGEGIRIALSFYISDENKAELKFYDLDSQYPTLIKQIKPSSCWEENFNIQEIARERVTINGKEYNKNTIFKAVYFPITTDTIQIPSLAIKMLKYKVAKSPSFFGNNYQKDFKTYYSKPKTITVKELPPHPLKDKVSVGDYMLTDRISHTQLETGQSFTYDFIIHGTGNISAISEPEDKSDDIFDIYAPNVNQTIRRDFGTISGSKAFSYYAIPKEPGQYNLAKHFEWIFFNPSTEQYDTLHATATATVSGESKKNEFIQSNSLGDFYNLIEEEDNSLISIKEEKDYIRIFVNTSILLMLALVVFVIYKKKS